MKNSIYENWNIQVNRMVGELFWINCKLLCDGFSISAIRRSIWVIVCLVVTGSLFYNIICVIQYYFSYEVTATISVDSYRSLEFPAVTICNQNSLRKTQASHPVQEMVKLAGKYRSIQRKSAKWTGLTDGWMLNGLNGRTHHTPFW